MSKKFSTLPITIIIYYISLVIVIGIVEIVENYFKAL